MQSANTLCPRKSRKPKPGKLAAAESAASRSGGRGRDPYRDQLKSARNLEAAGQGSEARLAYLDILRAENQHLEANKSLAQSLQHSGDVEGALEYWRTAAGAAPLDFDAQAGLAGCLLDAEQYEAAIDQYQSALKTAQKNKRKTAAQSIAEAQFRLARAYQEMQRFDEAQQSMHKAVQLSPRYVNGHTALGYLEGMAGDIEAAKARYRKALSIKPTFCAAHRLLAFAKRHTERDSEVTAMESLYESADLSSVDKMDLAFGLGKAYEDLNEYELAFEHWQQANKLSRELNPYRVESDTRLMRNMQRLFPRKLLRTAKPASTDIKPVFLISMPRAGSSLTEQILASHSEVYGGGELRNLFKICHSSVKSFPEGLKNLSPDNWRALGQKYIDQVRTPMTNERVITDKLPGNFLLIGAINMMFPEARIVHCRRDPMDTALSCYKNIFGDDGTNIRQSADLTDLGTWYKHYEKMMRHWTKASPIEIHTIQYENLTKDFEQEVRKLLDYIDIPFEAACLHFYESQRNTKTASSLQVREPIHQRSVKKWQNFETQLAPFEKARKRRLLEF